MSSYSSSRMAAGREEGRRQHAAGRLDGGQVFDFSGKGAIRWRELFPLPGTPVTDVWPGSSTCIRRRKARVRDRAREVNEIVGCLNEMYIPLNVVFWRAR